VGFGGRLRIKEWLYDSESILGEFQSNDASIKFVRLAYDAGAENIYGIDVELDEEFGSNTGELVVETVERRQRDARRERWQCTCTNGQNKGTKPKSSQNQENRTKLCVVWVRHFYTSIL
jgi:hypothetical protein